jgi:hypothetical protein
MSVQVRVVQSSAEALDVYHLRYQVYVEELKRTQSYADHEARTIEEPLDKDALLFAAYDSGRLVGSVRVNYGSRCHLGEYVSLYDMERVGPAFPEHSSITTKLLVTREYRNTSLAYRLAVACYRTAVRDGILHDFIDVYPARVPFFERLGYRVHIPRAVHSEFGEVIVMTINTRDEEHFKSVGSPFLRYLHQTRETQRPVTCSSDEREAVA